MGGESTGWAIQFESPTSIDGKQVRSIEIQFREAAQLESLVNKSMSATGTIIHRSGVERGDRVILAVSSIQQELPAASATDLTQLFGRIWRVTETASKPAPGTIYIFLANGTLLETSCVETYRIAAWTVDKAAPSVLRVVEEKQLAFTAAITRLTGETLHLQQTLARSNEKRDITLKAVNEEFVCPDLPKANPLRYK